MGFPVEFGIAVRVAKCLNDGPTRWSKTFSDRFSRIDKIPAVTDSQPPSHVAVAITLNEKASSLRTRPDVHVWRRLAIQRVEGRRHVDRSTRRYDRPSGHGVCISRCMASGLSQRLVVTPVPGTGRQQPP